MNFIIELRLKLYQSRLLTCELSRTKHCIVIARVCVFVCGSVLLQPARSVCVDSERFLVFYFKNCIMRKKLHYNTRSSADADNRLDAFSSQSRSTNMVPFHMLHIVSYCGTVTHPTVTIFVFKKFHDLEMGVKGHSRSLRVVSFDRLCMVSY